MDRCVKPRVDIPIEYVITELASENLIKMVDGELVSSDWMDESVQEAIDFAISDYYAKTEADEQYIFKSGDSVTRNIKSPDVFDPADLTTLSTMIL